MGNLGQAERLSHQSQRGEFTEMEANHGGIVGKGKQRQQYFAVPVISFNLHP